MPGNTGIVRFWIESICVVPGGPQRGTKVQLSVEERALIAAAYDGDGLSSPVTGPLAAYLALFHLCGPAAKSPSDFRRPEFAADIFSIWAAASSRARAVLRREGEHIVCPELGTKYPLAA
jgi:hypothetical protein